MTKKFYDIVLEGKGGGGSDLVSDSTNLDNWIGWLRKRVSIQNHEVDYLKLAMSEFAQQEAIAFAEWVRDERYVWSWNGKKWIASWDNHAGHSTEQLYSLFKTTKNG